MLRQSDEQETEPNLEEGTIRTSLLKKEEKPFSSLPYFKKHYLLGASVALSFLSLFPYEYFLEQYGEKGIQKTGQILPRLLTFLPNMDFSTETAKPWVMAFSILFTLGNSYTDFAFYRLQDFIDGYEKVFGEGFFSGLKQQAIDTLSSSCKNFFTNAPTTFAMLSAFFTLSYASTMTIDPNESDGWLTRLFYPLWYGSLVNYLLTQGPDTYKGIKFYLQSTQEEDAQKSLWGCKGLICKKGMRTTVFQTEIIRQLQNIMRGISGGFYMKSFLEFRKVSPHSLTMNIIPPLFGIFTAVQSHIARGPGIYQKRIGTDNMRFDLVAEEQITEKFEDLYLGKWKRFCKLKHPVAIAQTLLFGYAGGRLSSLIYDSPFLAWPCGGAVASLSLYVFYNAEMRRELAKRVLEENTDTTEEKDFAYYWAIGAVLLSYAAKTINGVPSTMSFCSYLNFLSDQDKIVMAYTIGTLVSTAGFEYYLPKVQATTNELFRFLKSKCGLSKNKSSLFAHPMYQNNSSINSETADYQPPVLSALTKL